MRVVMKFNGGPLDGIRAFDEDDVELTLYKTWDSGLRAAMQVYTGNITSAEQCYRIVGRSKDATTNTAHVVAEYAPTVRTKSATR